MKKILFVINPISGGVDKSSLEDNIRESSEKHSFDYYLIKTTGNDDPGRIQRKIAATNPDVIAVAGGDGTVNLVASLLINKSIPLSIIPMGSANGLAYELKIPSRINLALDLISEGKIDMLDAVKINENQFSFHLSDMGMNARIIRRFEKEGKRGFWGYFQQFLKEFRRIRKFRCIVEADGETIIQKSVMAVIANGSYYGTGANINPTGSPDDGKFEVILFKRYPSWYLFKLVASFFTGTVHKQAYIRTISCKEATIKVDPPQYLQIDGEILQKESKVTATIIPGAVQVNKGE